jgi:histidine ammonia-lyase/phenylalanine ammonia-lyase
MAAMMLYNLKLTDYLVELLETATAWQCMVLFGKRESFGPFINGIAKKNLGQKKSAFRISQLLDKEKYFPPRGQEVQVAENNRTHGFVQDRYSLRCAPQIFGPIIENLEISWQSLHHEINSVTDNPVVDLEGRLEMGGNFYGGYLCQAMDFIKINLAHLADLADRQLMMLMDEKSNQGLSTNLIDTHSIPKEEQHIHHGLKGVHQTVSAITSEVLQQSIPNGIFSRSSESHNQDKVSLGMSAAMSCHSMLQGVYKITAMHLICLAQAIDLRKITLHGEESKWLFASIRSFVPFISKDMPLGEPIAHLYQSLQQEALRK